MWNLQYPVVTEKPECLAPDGTFSCSGLVIWMYRLFLIPLMVVAADVATAQSQPDPAGTDSLDASMVSNEALVDSLDQLSPESLQAYLRDAANDPDLEGYRYALLRLARLYLNQSRMESAEASIQEGIRTGRTESDRWPFLDLRARMLHQTNETLEERRTLQEAIRSTSPREAGPHLLNLYMRLSDAHQRVGEMDLAFEQVYRALSLAEGWEWWDRIPELMIRIGGLFRELGNSAEAVIQLEQAANLARELEIGPVRQEAELGLARLFRERGDTMEALDLLESLRERGIRESELGRRWALEMGRWHVQYGEPQLSRRWLEESLQGFRDGGEEVGEAEVLVALAELEQKAGNTDSADRWLQEALDGLEVDAHAGQMVEIHGQLYKLHRESGEYLPALSALEALTSIEERMDEQEYERARAEFETRFEVRRRQEENRLLMTEQARQEARMSFQRWIGVGGGLLFLFLATISVYLYRDLKVRVQLNRDLEEKNRELDRLDGVKNRILAIVSHDLRGPLHSFDGLLQLLEKGKVTGEQLVKMGASLRGRIRANQMTMENLLAWAKTQMTGVELHPAVVTIRPVVERVWEVVSGPAEEKKLVLQIDMEESLQSWTDPDVVRLVLRNLLGNAIKFSHPGGTIVVRGEEKEDRIQVTVEDQGVGIPEEMQPHILAGEGVTTEGTAKEKGSGLGLTLSTSYVESQGGKLWFDSTPGAGTRFHFILPHLSQKPAEKEEMS
ncbi:MAG: ATP-binding protein [Bacteroidota bacterium]